MQIECPDCQEANQIEYAENIKCAKCEKTLANHYYKRFKKPIISTTFAVCLAALGGYKVEKAFSGDRYPMATEYELISACSSGQFYSLSRKTTKEKASLCVCALEKTVDDISYSDIKDNEQQFVTRFKANIAACY